MSPLTLVDDRPPVIRTARRYALAYLDIFDVCLENGRNVRLGKIVVSERNEQTGLATRSVANHNQLTSRSSHACRLHSAPARTPALWLSIGIVSIGVNHVGWRGCTPPPKCTDIIIIIIIRNLYSAIMPLVGYKGYIATPSPIRMINCIADKTAVCVLLRKQRNMYAFSIFPP